MLPPLPPEDAENHPQPSARPPSSAHPTGDAASFEEPAGRSAPPITTVLTALLAAALVVGGVWAYATGRIGSPQLAWADDPVAALDVAKQEDKPLLLFFTADWCPPCKQLKAGPLADGNIQRQITQNYVPVKIDLTRPSSEQQQIAELFGVRSIPTLIATSADGTGQEVARTGGVATPQLAAFLEKYAR